MSGADFWSGSTGDGGADTFDTLRVGVGVVGALPLMVVGESSDVNCAAAAAATAAAVLRWRGAALVDVGVGASLPELPDELRSPDTENDSAGGRWVRPDCAADASAIDAA